MANTITSAGSVGIYIINPLFPTGMSVRGLQGDGVFFEANQINDNARRILLTNGATTMLTNSARNGTLSFRVARVSKDLYNTPLSGSQSLQNVPSVQTISNSLIPGVQASGDLVLFAGYLQQTGQSTGSTIALYYDINGATEIVTFLNCGLKRCDPLKLSGSDVQIYEISFDYSDFLRT